ncbi:MULTISPECIES: sugar O-acetyltransferase [Clostridia]|uniref:Acetyltransferase n=1 Tax=Faecalicatena fissicatena TaxID=290055 RepID=A0ABS2E9I2_9FIRM|nr:MULTISPECIES: sugar O-acetyltransferase [Clostridia]MBM6738283.1 sugar O-acetyltransferase [Faecalicatena fissicatena]
MDREAEKKMHGGALYLPTDGDLLEEQAACLDLLYEYNHLKPSRGEEKRALLEKMFAQIGEGCYIETPFYANWGGRHVHFGSHIYANFNLTMVDDTHIYVGDHTMIGPNVIIAAGSHPVFPSLREQEYQFNMPVHVGKNCWIGAGAILLPGVTVGDNTVIGAGSVVTKDIPADVVAAGNPCRVMRPIGERDREFYFRDRRIDPGLL